MNKIFLIFSVLFGYISTTYAEVSPSSIELYGATNELSNSDFYSLNLSVHGKGKNSHIYAQINYAGFTNTYDANNNLYDNLFLGMGAEYNGQISPYIEAGVDVGLIGLIILDGIIDDTTETDCHEDDSCLSSKYNEDHYLTFGVRLFVTRQLTIGVFVEKLSFSNPGTDDYTHFKVTGVNLRYFYN